MRVCYLARVCDFASFDIGCAACAYDQYLIIIPGWLTCFWPVRRIRRVMLLFVAFGNIYSCVMCWKGRSKFRKNIGVYVCIAIFSQRAVCHGVAVGGRASNPCFLHTEFEIRLIWHRESAGACVVCFQIIATQASTLKPAYKCRFLHWHVIPRHQNMFQSPTF